ncbi:macrophage mannose receptor 1-like [Plakobranchus ocellatus]|uniref:Macrophage mannose receptor 1-like n=1 Tax=Plakobranchus ocellatus TaxID=259542 RepID=A0AAV4ACC5_9GAST|nr:macrophage mannose receptor 1-like [Plakobranchus ocellatus]
MARSLCQFLMVVAFLTVTAADPNKCAVGWSFFEGSCYYVGAAGSNFTTAKKSCRDLDSKMVTISSPEENTFIKSILKDDDATGAWFGLVLTQKDLSFDWNNLDKRLPISFTDWGNKKVEVEMDIPENRKLSRDVQCASFSKQYDWAWESKPCDDSAGMKYVCKRCATEEICTSRTCFKLLCGKDRHLDAEYECNMVGGSLATIRSEEESKTIKDFLDKVSFTHGNWGQPGSEVWLAGTDANSEGDWYWETNEEQETISNDFTDWAPNEPNNAAKWGENCMAMSVGDWKWNDIECWVRKFSLCEIPDVNAITG